MLPQSAVTALVDGMAATGLSPLDITIKLPIGLKELKRLSPGVLLVGVVMAVALGLAYLYVKTRGGGGGAD